MNMSTFVSMGIVTHDGTEIGSHLHMSGTDEIATIDIKEYPVAVTIHVTRQSLRNLIDACLDLQAKLAEREAVSCPT